MAVGALLALRVVPLDVEGDGESETEIVTTVPVPVGTYSNFKFEVNE